METITDGTENTVEKIRRLEFENNALKVELADFKKKHLDELNQKNEFKAKWLTAENHRQTAIAERNMAQEILEELHTKMVNGLMD